MKTPKELDAVVDAILSYKPKPKTKAAKRRVRREKRAAKKRGLGLMYIIPHYCDRNGIQWADELARASRNYREETAPTT